MGETRFLHPIKSWDFPLQMMGNPPWLRLGHVGTTREVWYPRSFLHFLVRFISFNRGSPSWGRQSWTKHTGSCSIVAMDHLFHLGLQVDKSSSLVGGLAHFLFSQLFPYIRNVIIPTDEVIFFRGYHQPDNVETGWSHFPSPFLLAVVPHWV